MLHESVGICIFLLIIARITYRFAHPAPALPPNESMALPALAKITHWLLYSVLLVMPVTGYLMAGNGQAVPFFRILPLPGLPKNEALGVLADTIHVDAQFAVYGLVLLHIAGTVWHVAIRRDGLLDRMLPPQRP